MTTEMDAATLAQKLIELEATVRVKDRMISELMREIAAGPTLTESMKALATMTMKQHATLQMVLKGWSNALIAHRLGISESTAKSLVRAIAAKLDVVTRTQVVLEAMDAFNDLSDEDYEMISGGLPKNWLERWPTPAGDPFAEALKPRTESQADC